MTPKLNTSQRAHPDQVLHRGVWRDVVKIPLTPAQKWHPALAPDEHAPKALIACGSGCVVLVSEERQEMLLVPTTCKRWDCPRCAPRKMRQKAAQARAGAPERLLTLTLKPRPNRSLYEQVDFIRAKFRALVQRIRRNYPRLEYFAALELQRNGTPHIHALTRGSYISQKWLSAAWRQLTGSYIVHIRKVDHVGGAVQEATKYLLKTAESLQKQLPGIPLITMSRGWLPDDWGDRPDAPEHYDYKFYLTLPVVEAFECVLAAGGVVVNTAADPWRYKVHLPNRPSWGGLQIYHDAPSFPDACLALVLRHIFDPSFAQGVSLEDRIDTLWLSTHDDDLGGSNVAPAQFGRCAPVSPSP